MTAKGGSSILILLLTAFCCAGAQQGDSTTKNDAVEKQVRVFEEWDRKNSFPKGAVLFVGNSWIKHWNTRECFTQSLVINRGIDLASITDLTRLADRIVVPYAPGQIVVFIGDTEIERGRAPGQVLSDYKAFTTLVQSKLPETQIVFMAMATSPGRSSYVPKIQQANRLIRDFCGYNPKLVFVDAAGALLNGDGLSDGRFFLEDQSRLNSEGYRVWSVLLKPVLVPVRQGGSNESTDGDRASQQEKGGGSSAGFAASKNSRIFHRTTCRFVSRISPENIVRFAERSQAVQTGRRPCKTCNP